MQEPGKEGGKSGSAENRAACTHARMAVIEWVGDGENLNFRSGRLSKLP